MNLVNLKPNDSLKNPNCDEVYVIEKKLGEGQFGTVYKAY